MIMILIRRGILVIWIIIMVAIVELVINGSHEEGGELAWEGLGFRVAGLRKAQRLWSVQPTSTFCCLLIVGATVCCDWCF